MRGVSRCPTKTGGVQQNQLLTFQPSGESQSSSRFLTPELGRGPTLQPLSAMPVGMLRTTNPSEWLIRPGQPQGPRNRKKRPTPSTASLKRLLWG